MKNLLGKVLIAVSITALAVVVLLQGVKTTSANPHSESVTTNSTTTVNSLATTTAYVTFTPVTATTTLAFDPQNGNIVQVIFSSYSTSTPPTLRYGLEMSNNGIDWYPFQVAAAGNPTALIAGEKPNLWSWTAATSTADETVFVTHVLTNSFGAKYGRLIYETSGEAAPKGTANIHAEVVVIKEF